MPISRIRKAESMSADLDVILLDKQTNAKISNNEKFKFNPWILKFNDHRHELEFKQEWHRGFTRSRRLILIIWILFHLSYLAQFIAFENQPILSTRTIILFSSLVIVLIPLAISFTKYSFLVFDPIICICFTLSSLAIAYAENQVADDFVNIAMVFFWIYFTVGFRVLFRMITITGVINVCVVPLLIIGSAYPQGKGVAMVVYIVSLVLGLEFVYTRELYARRVFIQRKKVQIQDKKIISERQKSQDLLRKCFPEVVLEELDEKGIRGISERFNDATIMFARITNLDPLLPAHKVVTCLNTIFSEFDTLTELYGLEKIKTIGSAIMIAGGIPKPSPDQDHTSKMAELALTLRQNFSVYQKRANQPNINLRIGIHRGPVVAGIINTSKLYYDIWSDAVNTASRMEQYGVDGEIQVSEAIWSSLHSDYLFESRGDIDIKGKGKMKTYFLRGKVQRANNLLPGATSYSKLAGTIKRVGSTIINESKPTTPRHGTISSPFQDKEEPVDTHDLEDLLLTYEVNKTNLKKWVFTFLDLRFPQKLNNNMEKKFRESLLFPEQSKKASVYKSVIVGVLIAIAILIIGLNDWSEIILASFVSFHVIIFLNLGVTLLFSTAPPLFKIYKLINRPFGFAFLIINGVFLVFAFPTQKYTRYDPTTVLVVLYAYFFMGVRVRDAFLINLINSAAIIAHHVIGRTINLDFIVLIIFLILINLLGTTLSLNMEIELRKNYLLSIMTLRKRVQQQKEKNKIDMILNSVLPSEIANRLKIKKNRDLLIAEDFNEVTILMCDIVGFTTISAKLSPIEVVSFLNSTFSVIEATLKKYNLELIKTVGDAVIVAGPLFGGATKTDAIDYAKKIGEFALEIASNIETPLHIGVHTGPVVAGVIGRKRFAYDVYGKTMDFASDLGAIGTPGQVFVSESYKSLLPNEYFYEKVDPPDLERLRTNLANINVYTIQKKTLIGSPP